MSNLSPVAILIKEDGTPVGTVAEPLRVDPVGTTAQPVTDNGGSLTVDGTVAISGTVPVSAASLPLPTGAATEATLALIKAKTDNLDVALSTRAVTGLTDAQLRATAVPVSDGGASLTVDGAVTVSNFPAVQPINDNGGSLTVDGTFWPATQPISAVALPLPTGAATAALQTQPGVDIGDVTVNNAAGAAAVNIQDGGNSITVDATSLPLPTGAATETTLAAINTKTPALGQALMAASSPVVIASNQSGVPVTDNAGSLTVDTPQLPAALVGGRLDVVVGASLPAGTNNIGDVDVLSVPAPLSTTGGGTEAAALRVTIANDSTGLVSVDDNGGSLTVDTPQLPAALVGGRLDENVGAWLGSTAPTVGQKARTSSIPVTIASDQTPLSVTFSTSSSFTGVSGAILTFGGGTANTLQVMRATAYTEPTAAAQRSIASASVNDTAAGTGARTVRLVYFDGTGAGPFTEDLTLNGTTPVNTVATNIRFIENIFVITVGSGLTNAGVITLYGAIAGGGGVVGTIGTGNIVTGLGDLRTLWAHHYSPINTKVEFSTVVASIQSGGSGTYGRFFLRISLPLTANSADVPIGDVILAQGFVTRSFDFHPNIFGFVRSTGYCVPGVNNATASLAFDWQEVPV
jgi:hypothetical protein